MNENEKTIINATFRYGEGLNYGSFGDKWNAEFDIEEQLYYIRHIEEMVNVAPINQWIADSEDPDLEA